MRESILGMKSGACCRFAAVVMVCAVAECASAGPFEWRMTVEEPDGRAVTVTSEAPRQDIEVALEPVETADGWNFTGRIVNNGQGLVTSFEGPIIKGLPVDKARSGFYVPEGFGRRVSDFAHVNDSDDPSNKWKKAADGEFTYETYVYPSRKLTMPWVAIDDGLSGASVMVLDTRASAKSFSLRYRPESDKAAIVPKHLVFIAPGQIWKLPMVSYVRYKGDWHAAARKYRAWYDTVHKPESFPAWTKQVNGWLLVILKQQNEEIFWPYGDFGKLADYADSLGLDMIGLFGWTVGGHDHLYPDYEPCPKMGGRDALVEGIKLLKKRGKRVCLYANGQLQHVGATRYWKEYGKDHSLICKDGGLVIQHYHKYRDIPNYDQALACLYSKPWFDRMLSLARNAKNLGADAILYDQLGVSGPYACYGKGHGHPVPAYSYAEERVGFLDRIAAEMRTVDPDFVIMTEGIHDTIMDSIAFWHGISYCSSRDSCESFMKSRGNGRNPGNEWPELVRYTFPELATTVRVPTPIVDRPMVNYTVVFGMRHDVELRYGPDRIYAETGNVTTNYGTVIRVPNFAILKSGPKETLAGYMKAVSDFQHANSDMLLEGRFVDTDGFTFAGKGCIAKRFIGKNGSGVVVWNMSTEPVAVNVGGLGKPQSVTEPEAGAVAPDAPLAPDTIRLYRFAVPKGAGAAKWAFATDAQSAGVCSGRITKSGKLEAEVHSSAAEGRWENVLPVGGKSVLVKARAEVTLDNPHSDALDNGVVMQVSMGGEKYAVAYSDYIEGVVTVRSFEDELPVPPGCTEAKVAFICGHRQLTARIFEIECRRKSTPAKRRPPQTFRKCGSDRPWPDSEIAQQPTEPSKTDGNRSRDIYETLKGVEFIGTVPTRHSRDIAESPVSIGFEVLDRCSFDPRWAFKFAGMSGAKHARAQSGWSRCERVKGRYDFDWLDEVVDGLAAEGVEAWLCCSYGNALYTPCEKFASQIEDCKARGVMVPGWARAYVGEAPYMHGPEAERAWLAYVRALARHFKGRVKVWEIWNEPEAFWRKNNERPHCDDGSKSYARFVRDTAAVIREEIPDARIAIDFARLSSGWVPAMVREGVVDVIDIFMFHGYQHFPEAGFRAAIEQNRALFVRKDGREIELWQGESGRATGPAANGVILPTQYSQARFITRRITNDIREGMKVSNIFTITDFIKYYPDGRNQYYGVVDGITRKPKDGFRALQAMGWLCDGLRRAPQHFLYFRPFSHKEFCDLIPYANVRTAAFERKGVPVLAFWQAQHVELNAAPLYGLMEISFGDGRNPLKDPILIDPVRCKVWDVRSLLEEDGRSCGYYVLKGAYALDYPLFLTDRSVLSM